MLAALRLYSNRAGERLHAYFHGSSPRRALWQLGQNLVHHSASRTASAMAFDLFLAFVPMLALAGWILANVLTQSEAALATSSLLFEITPTQMHDLVGRHFTRLGASQLAPLAGIGGWWLASSAFHTLITVYEEAFRIEPRPWYKTRLVALGCALLGIAALSTSGTLGFLVTLGEDDPVARLVGALVPIDMLGRALSMGASITIATGFFAFLFLVSVRRKQGVRRHVVPGAFVAVVLGATSTAAFGYYATKLGRFAVFYGSLAAVAITMAWLWIWCFATLLGAEVNVLVENIERDRAQTKLRNVRT